jgi:hypothetical protein
VGSSHWAAILDNVSTYPNAESHCTLKTLSADYQKISSLKGRLVAIEPPQEKNHFTPSTQGPDLLVGSIRSATRAEITAALPSRSVVDALVANFISTPDMGPGEFALISNREPT